MTGERAIDFGEMYVQLQETLEKERGEFALKLQSKDEDLLFRYSEWLEKHGYLDSDWREEGSAVEEFLSK